MRYLQLLLIIAVGAFCAVHGAVAQECPEEDPLKHYTGTGSVVCPCFIEGEEAGAVFEAPEEHYPIQILRVGIGWGSQAGGSPQQIEEAINIYGAGLPNPGLPLASLLGPQLYDGAINEFDIELYLGEVIIDSGEFTVTLQFLWDNVGDPFAPSMIHDGNGCQGGKNVVKAIPGGWYDACLLGVTGDWVIYVVYRPVNCTTGIEDRYVINNVSAFLVGAYPNPFGSNTSIEFYLAEDRPARLHIYDAAGRMVTTLTDRVYAQGRHVVTWDGRDATSKRLSSGVYFIELRAGDTRSVRKVLLTR